MIASIRSAEPELATVEKLCLTLEVSRSGFYAHKTKHLRPRRMQDAILSREIRQAFKQSRNKYGTVRLRCDLRVDQSMSRRGNCYDNATAESFWATLKPECFNGYIAATRAEARSTKHDF